MLRCNHLSAYPDEYLSLFGSPKDGEDDTIREFINALERITGPNGIEFRDQQDRLKFKGDALEVLSELFFTRFNSDPAIGLTNYTPISIEEDFGVDAKGTNANGDLSMVQVKYRSNPSEVVTYSEIARTFASGILQQGLDPTKERTIFVFTTAVDVSWQCRQIFENKLVVVGREIIAREIDNNRNFWRLCFEDVQNYVAYHTGDSFQI